MIKTFEKPLDVKFPSLVLTDTELQAAQLKEVTVHMYTVSEDYNIDSKIDNKDVYDYCAVSGKTAHEKKVHLTRKENKLRREKVVKGVSELKRWLMNWSSRADQARQGDIGRSDVGFKISDNGEYHTLLKSITDNLAKEDKGVLSGGGDISFILTQLCSDMTYIASILRLILLAKEQMATDAYLRYLESYRTGAIENAIDLTKLVPDEIPPAYIKDFMKALFILDAFL